MQAFDEEDELLFRSHGEPQELQPFLWLQGLELCSQSSELLWVARHVVNIP